LIVDAEPEYAAIVEPHCVVRLGMPPITPAEDQFTARLGSMMPDQACALEQTGIKSNDKNKNRVA
jgi:hypothetical protein